MRGQLTTEQRLKQVNARLVNENSKLRQINQDLRNELELKGQAIEDLQLRVAELEQIIFGKKKKGNQDDSSENLSIVPDNLDDDQKKERDKSSYRRIVPAKKDITDREKYPIDNCPDCRTKLSQPQSIIRYIEDIRLVVLNIYQDEKNKSKDNISSAINQIKQTIQQIIAKGYCPKCRNWHSGIPIASHPVTIGPKVKLFVAYAYYVLRMSYQQIKDILWDLYRFKLSDGEISNILANTAVKLNPEYERLKQRILQAISVHLDEASWQTGADSNYLWAMVSGDTEEAIFIAGRNRGKGNAEELLENYQGTRVTDCYPGYKNLNGSHQVCWVHILRKPKELMDNHNLSVEKRKFARDIYHALVLLYQEVKTVIATPFDYEQRLKALPELQSKLDNNVINKIANSNLYVKKLNDLQGQLTTYRDQLFTCVTHDGVAPDNNKAERKLRHLVLKRKNCFGTKTDTGSQVFSINASIILSLWWQDRDQFFVKFNQLMNGEAC